MKVFISWSGPQSQHIARALRAWLPRVIQHLDPWMSELDIGAGQRWERELWKELQDSHFGMVCLTPENLQAP
jgi:TIR domain